MSEQAETPITDELLVRMAREESYLPSYTAQRIVNHARQLERDRRELIGCLRELFAAESALYPPFEAGREAQDAWAERKSVARDKTRALLSRLDTRAAVESEPTK